MKPPETIRDYLMLIVDDGVRCLAVANAYATRPSVLDTKVDSLPAALRLGFNWSDSPEGGAFWVRVHYKLLKSADPEQLSILHERYRRIKTELNALGREITETVRKQPAKLT